MNTTRTRPAMLAVLALILVAPDAVAQGSVDSDRAALVELYHATDGPNWVHKHNWLSSEPLNQWFGVSAPDGRVEGLFLGHGGNNLSGSIPAELGELTQLERLGLDANNLSGPIPAELGRLTRLKELFLHTNNLSGPIPAELGRLTQLEWLALDANNLSGPIPVELGRLTQLENLGLGDNNLSGPIPVELGQADQLERLTLYSNNLSGPIPAELGRLTRLKELFLHSNNLSGPIPVELGRLTQLERLAIDGATGLCLPADFPHNSPFAREARSRGVPDCSGTELNYCPVTPQAPCRLSTPGGVSSVNSVNSVNTLQHPEDECTDCTSACRNAWNKMEATIHQAPSMVKAYFDIDLWKDFAEECFGKPLDTSSVVQAATYPRGVAQAERYSLSYLLESSDSAILSVVNEPDRVGFQKTGSGDVTLWVTASQNEEPVGRLSLLISLPTEVPVVPLPAIFVLGAALATMSVRLRRRRMEAAHRQGDGADVMACRADQ